MAIPRNGRTEKYPKDEFYHWTMGPGGVPLIDEMALTMDLKPGQRVLDLGCGMALSSLYLAREFDVQVVAFDLWIDASQNWQRLCHYGMEDQIMPIRGEAHTLPFAFEYFDAIFSMDAYQYFGTSDLYLNYLLKFLRPGGVVTIGGPALVNESCPSIPSPIDQWYQADPDLCSIHSADWWRNHWEKTGLVEIVESRELENGIDYWLETAEWTCEKGIAPPQGAGPDELAVFQNQGGDFFTAHILTGRKVKK